MLEAGTAIAAEAHRDRFVIAPNTAVADSREAAARLNVHVNTVRYRMGRLREEVSLDLDDPLSRLVITLQLALLSLQRRDR